MSGPTWFSPWEPPPHFCPAVADPQLNERIDVTVRFAAKSGPGFLDMMKQKHQGDPNFAFLFAGEAYHRYRWCLHCALLNLNPDQQPAPPSHATAQQQAGMMPHMPHMHQATAPPMQPMQPMQPSVPPPAQPNLLPPDIDSGFKQVLEGLTGSKVGNGWRSRLSLPNMCEQEGVDCSYLTCVNKIP